MFVCPKVLLLLGLPLSFEGYCRFEHSVAQTSYSNEFRFLHSDEGCLKFFSTDSSTMLSQLTSERWVIGRAIEGRELLNPNHNGAGRVSISANPMEQVKLRNWHWFGNGSETVLSGSADAGGRGCCGVRGVALT